MASKSKKPARKPAPKKPAAPRAKGVEKQRFWLMYPPRLITTPVMWQLVHKFDVITNIRQASVTDEIGIVCLELEGRGSIIKSAVAWLEKQGVSVEPVEINIVES